MAVALNSPRPHTELVGTQHSLLTTTISLTRFEQPLSPAANE